MEKTTFILSTDYEEYIEDLEKEEIADLFLSILRYEKTGEVPEKGSVSTGTMIAFKFIKGDLDRNREKYADKCKTNAENGKKGGRPKKETIETEKTERFSEKPNETQENPTKPYMSSGSEYDNDNEYDTTAKAVVVAVEPAAAAADETEKKSSDGNIIRAYTAKEREEVRKVYEDTIGKWSKPASKVLFSYGLPPEQIAYALTEAAEADVKKLSYIKAILKRMQENPNSTGRDAPKETRQLGSQELIEMRRRLAEDREKYGEEM